MCNDTSHLRRWDRNAATVTRVYKNQDGDFKRTNALRERDIDAAKNSLDEARVFMQKYEQQHSQVESESRKEERKLSL